MRCAALPGAQLWDGPGETTQSNVLKMQMLEDKALKFRGHTSQIINQLKQPVHARRHGTRLATHAVTHSRT